MIRPASFWRLVSSIMFMLLLLLTYSSATFAKPSWLREGVYAVYRFECAYALESREGDLIRLRPLGGGYYRWVVVRLMVGLRS